MIWVRNFKAILFNALIVTLQSLGLVFLLFGFLGFENGQELLLFERLLAFRLRLFYGVLFAVTASALFATFCREELEDSIGLKRIKSKKNPLKIFWLTQAVTLFVVLSLFCVFIHPYWMSPVLALKTNLRSLLELLTYWVMISPFWSWLALTTDNKRRGVYDRDPRRIYEASLRLATTSVGVLVKSFLRSWLLSFLIVAYLPVLLSIVFYRFVTPIEKFLVAVILGTFVFNMIGLVTSLLARKRILRDFENFQSFDKYVAYDEETGFSRKYSI